MVLEKDVVCSLERELIERFRDRTHETCPLKRETKTGDIRDLNEGCESFTEARVEVAFDRKGENGIRPQQFQGSPDSFKCVEFSKRIRASRFKGNRNVAYSQVD
jgi:hypothetical protein